ncbi:hypothetical protein DIPPA_06682 [Diplonema papillatum]|nr:hypothetical protein DIPPA_06682 [Diplonema papillatum]
MAKCAICEDETARLPDLLQAIATDRAAGEATRILITANDRYAVRLYRLLQDETDAAGASDTVTIGTSACELESRDDTTRLAPLVVATVAQNSLEDYAFVKQLASLKAQPREKARPFLRAFIFSEKEVGLPLELPRVTFSGEP